jgi:enoyl-CoA hydratase
LLRPAPYSPLAALSSPTTEQRPARVERDGPLATIVIEHRLANGPTKAHAATKAIVQAVREGGVGEADRRTPEITGALVDTDDFRNGLGSFLTEGPGKAKFKGR